MAERQLALVAVALFAVALVGCRQQPTTVEPSLPPTTSIGSPGMAPPDIGQLAVLDRDFLRLAASNSAMQVDASRLALERTATTDVRTLALRLVDDHTGLHSALREHAQRLGLGEPAVAMLPLHTEHLERMRPLEGRAFEQEYVAQIGVGAHVEALAIYERASTTIVDGALRELASNALPQLRQHLQQAERVAVAVDVPSNRLEQARARPAIEAQSTLGTTGVTGTRRDEGAGVAPATGADSAAAAGTSGAGATPGGATTTTPTPQGGATTPPAPAGK